jgi:arabinofuranosyltransferase
MVVAEAGAAESRPSSAIQPRALLVVVGGLLVLGAASMLYGAWLSDDYLIGLRQSLNLVHGRGFSFFADARVQTMTSPLWGIALAPVVWLFDAFYAPMLLSVALSMGAIMVLHRLFWREAVARLPFLLSLAVLVGSKGFIDFSTSGLENPLAHLWAALLFATWSEFERAPTSRGFRKVCLYAALLCLTRYDYAILVFPVMVSGIYRVRARRQFVGGLVVFAACCVPWLAFSLVYYGTVLPNAFYAKLTTAIPLTESVQFGLRYYQATWIHDPTSLVGITLGIGLVCRRPSRRRWLPMTLGVLSYLAYIIPAGGDFMIGRFLSVPMLVSVGLLTDGLRELGSAHFWKIPTGLLAYVMIMRPALPLLDHYSSRESMDAPGKSPEVLPRINDEKSAYIFDRGLMTGHRGFAGWLASRVALWNEPVGSAGRRAVVVDCGGLGWRSFDFGPDAHVYDHCALADPFLSKLPLYRIGEDRQRLGWGPGHFTRSEPEGYSESVATGTNALRDPVLADVYDAIQDITAGPIFGARRWRSILRLATLELVRTARAAPSYSGVKYPEPQETKIAPYAFYSNPFRSHCGPENLAERVRRGEPLQVLLNGVTHSHSIKLTGTQGIGFQLTFLSAGAEVGRLDVDMPKRCSSGLGLVEKSLPTSISEKGFDTLRIGATGAGDTAVHLGGLILDGVPVREPSFGRRSLVFDEPACRLPNRGEEATEDCSVIARPETSRGGYLIYGPYARLQPNGYLFEIEYSSSAPRMTASGHWDVAARIADREEILARGELIGTSGEAQVLTGRFWVPRRDDVPAVEVRVSPVANARTEIRRLRIYESAVQQ